MLFKIESYIIKFTCDYAYVISFSKTSFYFQSFDLSSVGTKNNSLDVDFGQVS